MTRGAHKIKKRLLSQVIRINTVQTAAKLTNTKIMIFTYSLLCNRKSCIMDYDIHTVYKKLFEGKIFVVFVNFC